MRYVIQAVWSRRCNVEAVQEVLRDAVCYYDFAQQPTRAQAGALLMHQGGAHVHLEDDAQLCEGFQAKAEAAIAERPGDVIAFFPGADADPADAPTWNAGAEYVGSLCSYFPEWFAVEFFAWSIRVEWHPEAAHRWSGLGQAVAAFLRDTDRGWWRWHPVLVQHRAGMSAIRPAERSRQYGYACEAVT